VKGVAKVPFSFVFELRDTFEFGFLLPPEQIIPNGEEIMACLVEMEKSARILGYYNNSKIVSASIFLIAVALILALLEMMIGLYLD
jgi:hypothetical protein